MHYTDHREIGMTSNTSNSTSLRDGNHKNETPPCTEPVRRTPPLAPSVHHTGALATPVLIGGVADPQGLREPNAPNARQPFASRTTLTMRAPQGSPSHNLAAGSAFTSPITPLSIQPDFLTRGFTLGHEHGAANHGSDARPLKLGNREADNPAASALGYPPGYPLPWTSRQACATPLGVSGGNGVPGGVGRSTADTAQQRHEKLLLQQRNVYISGLPPSFKPPELKKLCDPFGNVESVKLCMIDSASLMEKESPRKTGASHIAPLGNSASHHSVNAPDDRGDRDTPSSLAPDLSGNKAVAATPSEPRRHEIIPACKGYGFVLFQSSESATACIAALNNKVMWGKPLQARRADLTAAPPRKGPSPSAMALPPELGYSSDWSPRAGLWPPAGTPEYAEPLTDNTPHLPSYALAGAASPPLAQTLSTTHYRPCVATAPSFFASSMPLASRAPTSHQQPTSVTADGAPTHASLPYSGTFSAARMQPGLTSLSSSTMSGSALQMGPPVTPTYNLGDSARFSSPPAPHTTPPTVFPVAGPSGGAVPVTSQSHVYGNVVDYHVVYLPSSPGVPVPLVAQRAPDATTFASPAIAPGAGGHLVYYVISPNGQAYALSGR